MYFVKHPELIFSEVKVMIYVFDVEKMNPEEFEYYKKCMENLKEYSPEAFIFVLFHKTDLLDNSNKEEIIQKYKIDV